MGDHDDFPDEFGSGFDPGLELDEPPDPTWRATIRRGGLTLTGWAPFLISEGPLATLLPARERAGVTIADLTIYGADDDEVSVRYLALGTGREVADAKLTKWAQTVGYSRLWLPNRLVDLQPTALIGEASVRCPTCRSQWRDSTPNFWSIVRDAGSFPKWCPMCGCELPQWTVGELSDAANPRR
jgi:hypothetical protein